MRTIIYQFKVKDNQNEEFIEAWKEMTELIYKYENSLGSRLHKKDNQTYIAYAQWPDKITFENSGSNLPEEANQVRQKMRGSCENVEKLLELEVIEDLLK
jgi:heme-degrading monooxygenase HmoA